MHPWVYFAQTVSSYKYMTSITSPGVLCSNSVFLQVQDFKYIPGCTLFKQCLLTSTPLQTHLWVYLIQTDSVLLQVHDFKYIPGCILLK